MNGKRNECESWRQCARTTGIATRAHLLCCTLHTARWLTARGTAFHFLSLSLSLSLSLPSPLLVRVVLPSHYSYVCTVRVHVQYTEQYVWERRCIGCIELCWRHEPTLTICVSVQCVRLWHTSNTSNCPVCRANMNSSATPVRTLAVTLLQEYTRLANCTIAQATKH